jgi:hypothetical protein
MAKRTKEEEKIDDKERDFTDGDLDTDQDEQSDKENQRANNWLNKIKNARRYERRYRYDAYQCYEQYRGNKVMYDIGYAPDGVYTRTGASYELSTRMNLFHANTQTLSSTILPQMPKVVVEKRASKDTMTDLNKKRFHTVCCEVVEKALTYFIQQVPWNTFKDFKLDYLVTGRGVLWVSYSNNEEPNVSDHEAQQQIHIDRVSWSDFAMDPKTEWCDVKWVARRTFLNRGEFELNFPDADMSKANFKSYKNVIGFEKEDAKIELFTTGDKFIEVWEVWDRDTKTANYFAEQYDDKMLKRMDVDEVQTYFLPTPEPLLSVRNGINMMPRSEFWLYHHELQELSEISYRKAHLLKSIQAKGFTSSVNTDLVQKLNSTNEGYIISVDGARFNPKDGNPIMYVDNQAKQTVIQGLNEQQNQLIDNIYKITGISEIMRNVSVEETATNARLRTKFGSLRLQERQRDMADYIKGIYKIGAMMICRLFTQKTLEQITNIDLRSEQDVQTDLQEAQAQYKQAVQQFEQMQQQFQQMQQEAQGGGEPQGVPEQVPQPQPGAPLPQQPQPGQQQTAPPPGEGVPPEAGGGQPAQQPQGQPVPQQPQQPQQPAQPQANPQEIQGQVNQVQQGLNQQHIQILQMQLQISNLQAEPTWEAVLRFLKKHKIADMLFDVETDFEALDDDPLLTQEAINFLQTFMQIIQNMVPAMRQDPTMADLMGGMIGQALQRYKMARQQRGMIEQYLHNMIETIKMQAQNPQPPAPDPNLIKAQAQQMEAEAKAKLAEAESFKVQAEIQNMSMGDNITGKQQFELQKLQAQIQAQQQRSQEKSQSDQSLMQMKIEADNNRYKDKIQSDITKEKIKQGRDVNLGQ